MTTNGHPFHFMAQFVLKENMAHIAGCHLGHVLQHRVALSYRRFMSASFCGVSNGITTKGTRPKSPPVKKSEETLRHQGWWSQCSKQRGRSFGDCILESDDSDQIRQSADIFL